MIGKLITLEELMKQFKGSLFTEVSALLGEIQGKAEVVTTTRGTQAVIPEIAPKLKVAISECNEAEMFVTGKALEPILDFFDYDPNKAGTYKQMQLPTLLYCARYAMNAEMETCGQFFLVERAKQHFIDDPAAFGDGVASAFPSAALDIHEASNCLAFDCWTASVFHTMKVLELGLQSLAMKLNVPCDRPNWGTMIDQIEKAIENARAERADADRKEKLEFYSRAATHFRYLKDAWRNHVMHVRRTSYNERQATNIFNHASDFMGELADHGLREEPDTETPDVGN